MTDGASSTDWITAVLKPSSSINNVYSFAMRFQGLGTDIPDGFEINDAHLVVFELAMAEILKSQSKYNQAGAHEARAAGIRSSMLSTYFQQSNVVQQSLPMGPGTSPFHRGDTFNRRISVVN